MRRELVIVCCALLSMSSAFASSEQHTITGNTVAFLLEGTPPFSVNIRGDDRIGEPGGYLWAFTNNNKISFDMSFVTSPPSSFYYAVKDGASWTSTKTFSLSHIKSVLLIIDTADYDAISPSIQQFKSDVESRLPVNIIVKKVDDLKDQTPASIRAMLQGECKITSLGCQDLEGAVFVGDVPYALYDSIYDDNSTAPFMFYYQDLDATFDARPNGHYYQYADHGVHEGPEIYVSWIRPIQDARFGSGIAQLKNYFDKHHRFFATPPAPQFVFAGECPITNSDRIGFSSVYDAYGESDVKEVAPPVCDDFYTVRETLMQEMSARPEAAYIHSHGNPQAVWSLNSDDLYALRGQPALLFSWGCSNGNFYGAENNSFALAFINGKDIGLSYVGKLHSTDMNITQAWTDGLFVNSNIDFFDKWTAGEYVGRALLDVQQEYAHKTCDWKTPEGTDACPDHEPKDLYSLSGPVQSVIVGSPFVYSVVARQPMS